MPSKKIEKIEIPLRSSPIWNWEHEMVALIKSMIDLCFLWHRFVGDDDKKTQMTKGIVIEEKKWENRREWKKKREKIVEKEKRRSMVNRRKETKEEKEAISISVVHGFKESSGTGVHDTLVWQRFRFPNLPKLWLLKLYFGIQTRPSFGKSSFDPKLHRL